MLSYFGVNERRKDQSSIVVYACMSTEKKPVILSSLFYYNTASYIQDKENKMQFINNENCLNINK